MQIQYRILSPQTDVELLQKILTDFINDEIQYGSPVYPLDAMKFLKNRCIENFVDSKNKHPNDYIVVGAFEDNEIVGVAIGQKIHHLWKMQHVILPTWILVLTYLKDRKNSSPKNRLHELISPIITSMENDGFYSWYKVSKFRGTEDLDAYISNVYSKIINAERYTVTVEAIVGNQEQRDSLPSTFRSLFPVVVYDGIRLGLLQHHYKNSLRKFNDK